MYIGACVLEQVLHLNKNVSTLFIYQVIIPVFL